MKLPNEVLDMVLAYLPRDLSQLAKVARVSRHFNALATPRLYRKVSVRTTRSNNWKQRLDAKHLTAIRSLLRALTDHPSLRPCVVDLSFLHEEFNLNEHAQVVLQILDLLSNLKSLSLSPTPLALDLSNQTQIDTLCLDFSTGNDPYDLKQLNKTLSSQVLARNFWIPTMRRLHVIDTDFGYCSKRNFPEDSYGTSPITELYLTTIKNLAEKPRYVLSPLIRSAKALQLIYLECKQSYGYQCGFREMIQLLKLHATTLIEVQIINFSGHCLYLPNPDSLLGFVALERLALSENFLFEYRPKRWAILPSQMPSNLRELQVKFYVGFPTSVPETPAGGWDCVTDLASAALTSLPALKTVTWWYKPHQKDLPSEDWKSEFRLSMSHIVAAFEQSDVDFDMVFEHSYSETPFGKKYGWNRTAGCMTKRERANF